LIDAHCGDLVEALQPFALYDSGPAENAARDLATAYGLPYVIRQQAEPGRTVSGSTSAAAAEAGIPAIIAEAGGCGLIEEHAVRMHRTGLDRVLTTLGMADGAGPGDASAPSDPVYLSRFVWLYSGVAGWWEATVRAGDTVAGGQVIGTVSSIDGAEVLATITAPVGGIVVFLTSSPAVADDGLLLGLGAR
jgi:predicted deacylase